MLSSSTFTSKSRSAIVHAVNKQQSSGSTQAGRSGSTRLMASPAAAAAAAAAAASSVTRPASDRREYRGVRLPNGVRMLLVHDKDLVFAAASANVQAGYFDDPPDVPGLAHYLEHAVLLGSQKYPDPKEYKYFLSQHGGSSNAVTSLVHTQFHLQVHASQLPGALDRLANLFVAPLLRPDVVLPEVENVHSEFSRNCNSDSRKLSQLKRSTSLPPYSKFSTGNISTLRDEPHAAGRDVVQLLRTFWEQHYRADRLCVCVVGPQDLDALQQAACDALQAVPPVSGSQGFRAPFADVVGAEQQGLLYHVAPQRELRSVEVSWYLPFGVTEDIRCKPWRWVSHLLGHEADGSVAHCLKQQGLLQSLSAGLGEEVRLGRGFMFWHVSLDLTERGLQQLPHVLTTLFRGLQVVNRMPDAQRREVYKEQADLAQLRFDWQDKQEALDLAKEVSFRLHYWDAADVLAGPAVLEQYNGEAIGRFLSFLTADRCNVFVSARGVATAVGMPPLQRERWYGAEYSVQPMPQQLRADMQAALTDPQQLVGQPLRVPDRCWALPVDVTLRPPPPQTAAPSSLAAAVTPADTSTVTPLIIPADTPADTPVVTPAVTPMDVERHSSEARPSGAPGVVRDDAGVRVWHQHDVSFGIPKAHIHVHLITPEVYCDPRAWVAARLYIRVLEAELQPLVYSAELAATRYNLSCHETGLLLHIMGFSSVCRKLLAVVMDALVGLGEEGVARWFDVVSGELRQSLQQWRFSNPAQHAQYGAEHCLQPSHWHATQCLEVLEQGQVGPGEVLAFARRLATSSMPMFAEVLAYGNLDRAEALEIGGLVQSSLRPAGLAPAEWPLHTVLQLTPPPPPPTSSSLPSTTTTTTSSSSPPPPSSSSPMLVDDVTTADTSAGLPNGDSVAKNGRSSSTGHSAVEVVYAPANPNPGNSNHGHFYLCQVGVDDPDDVSVAVLLELLARIASKPCFHQLRTRQRLGYVVACQQHKLHHSLGLSVRIQSVETTPDVLRARVRDWLLDFRSHLHGLSQSDFADFQRSLRERLSEPCRSLSDGDARAWGPIRRQTYDFRRREAKVAFLDSVALQDMHRFYDERLLPGSAGFRSLSCHIQGGATAAPAPGCTAEGRPQDGRTLPAAVPPATPVTNQQDTSTAVPQPSQSQKCVDYATTAAADTTTTTNSSTLVTPAIRMVTAANLASFQASQTLSSNVRGVPS